MLPFCQLEVAASSYFASLNFEGKNIIIVLSRLGSMSLTASGHIGSGVWLKYHVNFVFRTDWTRYLVSPGRRKRKPTSRRSASHRESLKWRDK